MNFIETIFDSFTKAIKRASGEIPQEIESYCIGSGSNFEIHAYISYEHALKIYEQMKKNLQTLGKRTEKKQYGNFIAETWHTMESNSGYTTTFMFPINKINFYNPNDVLEEWTNTLQKQKELKESFEKFLSSKK